MIQGFSLAAAVLIWTAIPTFAQAVIVNQPLTINAQAGLSDRTYDFSHAPTGITALTITGGPNDYGNGSVGWDRLRLKGNGTGIGLLIAANHITINQLTVSGFATDVQLGANGYSITLNQPFLYNATVDINCPQLPNTGEQIVINGGSVFNSSYGVLGGGCGMVMVGTSLDGLTQDSIVWWGGMFRGYGLHIENFQSPAGPIIENAGGNNYTAMDFDGLEIYQNTGMAQATWIKNPTSGATINFLGHTVLSGNLTNNTQARGR